VQVKISVRHGHLGDTAQRAIRDKAEKLLHIFDRITLIEVTVDMRNTEEERCCVEFVVQAEHKHDFVAQESQHDLMAAVDLALNKIQSQFRRYKEKIQDHRRTPSAGEVASGPRPQGATED
jgi:putative sigma-54 modulation protein